MNVIKLSDEMMNQPTINLVPILLDQSNVISYVFIIDMKYINKLEEFKIVTKMTTVIESWVYIAFKIMFELVYLPGIGDDEIIHCRSTEIPQIKRYIKLKKIMSKIKKSDC